MISSNSGNKSSSNISSSKLLFVYVQAGALFSRRRVQYPCTNFFDCAFSFMIPWIAFNKKVANDLNRFSVLNADRITSVYQAENVKFYGPFELLKSNELRNLLSFLWHQSVPLVLITLTRRPTFPSNEKKESWY
jgi:hypothetical protein